MTGDQEWLESMPLAILKLGNMAVLLNPFVTQSFHFTVRNILAVALTLYTHIAFWDLFQGKGFFFSVFALTAWFGALDFLWM